MGKKGGNMQYLGTLLILILVVVTAMGIVGVDVRPLFTAALNEHRAEAFPGRSTCKLMVEIGDWHSPNMLFTNEVDLKYLQQQVLRVGDLIYINPVIRIRPNPYLRK